MRLSPCLSGTVRQIAYPDATEPVPSWGRVLGVCLECLDGRSTPPSMCSSRVLQWPPESGRPHRSGKTPIGVGKLPCQWACATVAPGAGEGHRRGRARVISPSRCRRPPHNVDNPRPRPENAPVRPRTAARRDYAPRVPGGFPREAESTTGCLGCPSCSGDALFFVAVGGTKRKMPPRVWGLPVPAPRQGNARTRQG